MRPIDITPIETQTTRPRASAPCTGLRSVGSSLAWRAQASSVKLIHVAESPRVVNGVVRHACVTIKVRLVDLAEPCFRIV